MYTVREWATDSVKSFKGFDLLGNAFYFDDESLSFDQICDKHIKLMAELELQLANKDESDIVWW